MEGHRRFSIGQYVLGLALLLTGALPLGAQTFVEFGGGWNHVPPYPSATGHVLDPHGYNWRVAIGRALTPRVRVRVDAFTMQFNDEIQLEMYRDCFPVACSPVQHQSQYEGNVSGMSATGLVNIDRRGIFYAIGGAGMFVDADAVFKYHFPLRSELRLGVVAGAGLAVPLGARLRAFAEARWTGPFGNRLVAPWIVPVTLGMRY